MKPLRDYTNAPILRAMVWLQQREIKILRERTEKAEAQPNLQYSNDSQGKKGQ